MRLLIYREWENNEILEKGSEKAREVAASTLDDVKKAMKINYFDDKALIEEHTRKFKK